MSDEIKTESKAVPPPSHGEMFFRYVAALAQTAGIQAFTMAVAVPKEDGTSAIMAVGVGAAGTSKEWQEETSKLLGLPLNSAVGEVVRVFHDPQGRVMYLAEITYRAEYIRFQMELKA